MLKSKLSWRSADCFNRKSAVYINTEQIRFCGSGNEVDGLEVLCLTRHNSVANGYVWLCTERDEMVNSIFYEVVQNFGSDACVE